MAEKDSLSKFDFNRVGGAGKFLKFVAGESVTIRVLTKDPVVTEQIFKNGEEESFSTKFNFVVWNFTAEKAQILSATATMCRTFQRVATDEDYGSNLQKCDFKISAEGEKKQRTYDINVLRHSGNEKELTKDMIEEARKINLDKDVQDNKGRLSVWEPPVKDEEPADYSEDSPGHAEAKKVRDALGNEDNLDDEPINIDEIPFN